MLMFDFLWMTCNKSYDTWVRFPQLAQLRRPELKSSTAGPHIFGFFIFYHHIKYHLLNMLKIKCDSNKQYLKTADLHFVKSE